VAAFDRAILPGGEGKIELEVRTEGRFGKLRKRALVVSSDPVNGRVEISVEANIIAPMRISSIYVGLYAKPGQKVTRVVEIEAMLDKPLELHPAEFNLPEDVEYSIEEVTEGRKFRIHFSNVPGQPHRFSGYLKLKTNYVEKPKIKLRINGLIEARR
jgi:hypothetical protein